jgi:hypothetical protein
LALILLEEVGNPSRALAPIVNGKDYVTGWKAFPQPQLEFKAFEAVDHIGFSLQKRQLILKLPRAGRILVLGFPCRMVS